MKMAEEQDMELTPSPRDTSKKCIYMWDDSHRTSTRNAGSGPQTSKRERKSPCNWVRQKKNREKESGQDLWPWDGVVKEERSPCWQGDQLGQAGLWSLRGRAWWL